MCIERTILGVALVLRWSGCTLRVSEGIVDFTSGTIDRQITHGTGCPDAVLNAVVDDVMIQALVDAVLGPP